MSPRRVSIPARSGGRGHLERGAELHAEAEVERRRIRETCGELPIVLPDDRVADAYARIHGDLVRRGASLATMDLLIAATALTRDASLLTANEAHFARVPGLRVLGYRST